MSREDKVLEYLVQIKSDVATLKEQLTDYPDLKEAVHENSEEIIKAKASLATLRWVFGVILVGAPTTLYAVMRVLN